MKIAVLLSTYNGERYLDDLLNSIYNQRIRADLIVCIRDDGSKDKTIKIIEKWSDKIKIILSRGKNLGPRDSFNDLINTAPLCDYYAFCDQDDIWHEDKLDVAVKALNEHENNQPLLYYCNATLIDEYGNCIKKSKDTNYPALEYSNLIVQNPALGCEMVFNNSLREFMQKVDFKYYFMHDVVAIELASLFGTIVYDKIPRMDYRQHIESVTQGHDIIRKFVDKFDFWFFQKNISICKQAEEILGLNPKPQSEKILMEIAKYKKGINRFKVIFNKAYRVNSFKCNRSFILRVLIGVA